MWDTGRLCTSKSEKLAEGQGLEYKDYFQFTEPIRHIPPHRILALNRGEKENALQVKLEWDAELGLRVALERLPLPLPGSPPPLPETAPPPVTPSQTEAGPNTLAAEPMAGETSIGGTGETPLPPTGETPLPPVSRTGEAPVSPPASMQAAITPLRERAERFRSIRTPICYARSHAML